MGWILRERRGPSWKQGWTDQLLVSISPPPFPLLAIFAIIFLLLSLSSYANYKYQMQQTMINLKMFLLFLPVLLIFVALLSSKCERLVFPYARTKRELAYRAGELPWGVVVLVVVLLLMLSYQSYFRSMWTPSLWRVD